MRKLLIITFLLVFTINIGFSQVYLCDGFVDGYYSTSSPSLVHFLNFSFNPQSTSLGNSGIAISSSITALSLNSSNLAFIDSKWGIQASYVPWSTRIEQKNIYSLNVAGYSKLDKMSTIGASIRYFNLSNNLNFNPNCGSQLEGDPSLELEGLLSYNRKLNSNFAVGLSLKYIYSRMETGQNTIGQVVNPLNTIAGDLSLTYRKPLSIGDKKSMLISGLTIRNFGPKVTYVKDAVMTYYLPANLGIGLGLVHEFSENHTLTVSSELNRLLVPTYSWINEEGDSDILDYREKSAIQGMLSSFGDAPGGLGEDFNENQYSLGVEYRYQFIVGRIGHFNQHRTKGNSKLLTCGLGFRAKGFGVDFSYAASLNQNKRYPETWRVAMSYDFIPTDKQSELNEDIIH